MNLRGKRIVIMGLGLNGGGLLSAQFCLACGAEVLVTDLNPAAKLADSLAVLEDFACRVLPARGDHSASARLKFRLGSHELQDFQRADWIVKNPGVPGDSPYLLAAKSWTTDLALFLEWYPQVPILAVTGTKGKSSISYALHYILQQYWPQAMLAGNIGCSPLSYALSLILADKGASEETGDLSGESPLVLELSSWQLADLRAIEASRGQVFFRPVQACLSNILKDHQNRYAHFYDYVADKFYIFEHIARSGGGELLLESPPENMFLGSHFWSDFAVRALHSQGPRSIRYFSSEMALPKEVKGLYWLPEGAYIRDGSGSEQLFLLRQSFPVLGRHSFRNYALASYMAYRFLRKLDKCDLVSFSRRNQRLMTAFCGVPFRMELRGRLRFSESSTLSFINDTTATMPDATAEGVEACMESGGFCLLIAGGTDKDLEPAKLLTILQHYQGRYAIFLLAGNGTQRLLRFFESSGLPYVGVFTSLSSAFQQAVRQAAAQTAEYNQQYLLLSPGYASFGMFHNEFDRGRQFNALVEDYLKLKNQAPLPEYARR